MPVFWHATVFSTYSNITSQISNIYLTYLFPIQHHLFSYNTVVLTKFGSVLQFIYEDLEQPLYQ